MDKHMIHIDDLVRQKLGGTEEADRSAPWLKMRELLDKEMPTHTVPAAFNWRRLYSAAAGLLLLASVGGGYALYQSSLPSSITPNNGDNIAANSGNSNYKPSGSGINNAPIADETIVTVYQKEGTEEVIVESAPVANNTAADGNSSGSASVASVSGNLILASKASNTNRTNRNSTNSSIVANSANNTDTETSASGNLTQSSPSLPIQAPATNSVVPSSNAIADNNNSTQNSNGSATPQLATQEPVLASTSTTGNSRVRMSAKRGTTPGNVASNNSNEPATKESVAVTPMSSNSQRKTAQQIDSQRFTLIRDTFQKITMRKRYLVNPLTRTGSYITDTIATERVAIDKWVAKDDIDPVLAAASKKDAKVKTEMVPLSSKMVKSHKTSRWDAQQFKDIVRDAKFNMSQIRFYPGITAGVNASLLGPTGLTGFQLGVTSLFTFGDKWGASVDAKYFQRFNGNTLDDNYYVFGSSNGNTYRKTVEHNFKFSSMQSIEMPIAVRYTFGRFTGLAGANLAYNFAINAEEFTRTYDSTGIMITPQYNMTNDRPTVGISDFNSRFTGGYLVGINYQVTPALGLDMRMTQNVWNGAKGVGAQKVFDNLYKTPSFQISVGYRFSNNPKFPKAR